MRGIPLVLATVGAALAASVPAQQFAERPVKAAIEPARTNAQAWATADFDGDGDVDLLTADLSRCRLYRNGGRAELTEVTATRLPVLEQGFGGLAVGDVDGDGDVDAVLANGRGFSTDRQNRLLLNDGSGTFVDATPGRLPVDGDDSVSVGLHDVDADGDLDALFVNLRQQSRLYLNDGAGTFTDSAASLPIGTPATICSALGDVDADGDVDVVLGSIREPGQLWLNDGSGGFTNQTATRWPTISDSVWTIALADLDGDGDLDAYLGTQGLTTREARDRVFLNDGSGTFSDASATHAPPIPTTTQTVSVGDVDADGDPDVFVGTLDFGTPTPNRLWVNDGSGRLRIASPGLPADPVATASSAFVDLDGDSRLDIVTGNLDRHDGLYLNDGTGVFRDVTAPRVPGAGIDTYAVLLTDLTGDGIDDVVLGNDGGPSRVGVGDGNGVFRLESGVGFAGPSIAARGLDAADVDGDGDQDIAVAVLGANRLYLNNGFGSLAPASPATFPALAEDTFAIRFGDVDGDGDADVFVCNRARNRLLLNDGTGAFTDATVRVPGDVQLTRDATFFDLEGDGDLDLACANTGQNRIYRNDGLGSFTDVTTTVLPVATNSTKGVCSGDVDGDGDGDLVFTNSGRRPDRLYLNDGNGSFVDATARLPTPSVDTYACRLVDVDRDGDLDLVTANYQERNRLYLNDGTGTFTDRTDDGMPTDVFGATIDVAVADLDGDADVDAVFANVLSDPNFVYLNLERDLAAPFPVQVDGTFRLEATAEPLDQTNHLVLGGLNLGLAPNPVSVPPLGTFRVATAGLLTLPPIALPAGTGTAALEFGIPNDPALVDQSLCTQALVLDVDALQRDPHFTNVTCDVIDA